MIDASAPVRICDIGGWTDTWFGGPGRVVNVAVSPGVAVTLRASDGPDRVMLDVQNFGDRYGVVPGLPRRPRHPLLEAAIDAVPPPADRHVDISVRSAVPPGSGTGTSAAIAVALLGALAAACGAPTSGRQIAAAAHRLEVDVLGRESGVQDQLCAVFGGINALDIAYLEAEVHPLPLWEELSSRLSLVFLGQAHDSSALHRKVIVDVEGRGPGLLSGLRQAAVAARRAVLDQDLVGFGRAMITNTDAQRTLHRGLVGADADRVIDAAATHGAIGWKVNGAGGDGGSLTLLSASPADKAVLDRRVSLLDQRYWVLPVQVSPTGLEVRGNLDQPGSRA